MWLSSSEYNLFKLFNHEYIGVFYKKLCGFNFHMSVCILGSQKYVLIDICLVFVQVIYLVLKNVILVFL
jgi:hypothetical protein